ncbi:unnamed protein product [Protopolystoma xenopodis]|uniref:Uncharacterized protein n=1 Tax=Protopolystoma xenopodis TaxID=117903 RepID=A0A3S5FF79_9PLAT|nr:unnamed protein product [Protopolystoma xenopodis]
MTSIRSSVGLRYGHIIEHFILLSAWLSVYLDAVCLASLGLPSSTTTSTTSVDPWFETCANLLFSSLLSDRMPTVPQLPASMIGLLVLAAHRCLVRAPISAHDDINHRVSMVCLGLIARLAIAPGHW